jgi:cellulose synthase/poly-beta-1,6-N-acetylglucosamine synthase-like glycosyltransferase
MTCNEKISLIIPVYNNPDGLAKTLASIDKLEGERPEVIVVDDGSSVSHQAVCDAHGAKLVCLPQNAGPGAARNEGVKLAAGGILAFTDSDCTVPPNWLATIRKEMDDAAVVAVAGGYGGEHVDGIIPLTRFMEAAFYHLHERTLVNTFVTANFAIRTHVFKEAGGFPVKYYGEDLILGIRLKEKGHMVVWQPELRVGQFFRASFPAYFRQQVNWSMAAALISAEYPETRTLTWSVRRSSLMPQLFFELGLVASLGLLVLGALWPLCLVVGLAGWALSLAGLAALNFGLFRFVAQQRSLGQALGVMSIIVAGRNLAWLLGCLKALCAKPAVMVPFLFRMLRPPGTGGSKAT